MRVSTFLIAVGFLIGPALAGAQAQPAPRAFTPVPCPPLAWTYQEPDLTALPGAKLYTGRYEGGLYAIEIPDTWNGELALYAHGQVETGSADGRVIAVRTPSLRTHWIKNGFAWAASSYRCNGTVYGEGLLDTLALHDLFVKINGGRSPERTYLAGHSLGGRITVLGLREFPSSFAGGLAMCPVGPETWDQRVAIAAAAELVTGVRPAVPTLSQSLSQMASLLGKSPDYTPAGAQLASVQIELTGGPRPFALEGLAQRFLDNIRTGVSAVPDEVIRAATNIGIDYLLASGLGITANDFNVRVPRKPPEVPLRLSEGPYRELLPFDGELARPLLTIHGTGDLQVPVSQEQAMKRAVLASGRTRFLVQRLMRIPGHCRFSEAEETRAFDDLVAWVRTGQRPEGDEVLGDLSDAGMRFTNPLRPGDPGTRAVAPR